MTVLPEVRNLVLPLPVTLTTCRARKGDASSDNIIPLSWVGIADYQPDMVHISIGTEKYSARVIAERKEFGLCIATEQLIEAVDRCGYAHGNETDKFKMTGLTKTPAREIDAVLIGECPIGLECRVTSTVELKTHTMFIAEVLCTHVQEGYLDGDGTPELGRMNVLCYADGRYWALGREINRLYYTKSGTR